MRQIATALLERLSMHLDLVESAETLCLLSCDAAKYMVAAGATPKCLYPKLCHVTRVAHLLHNCAIKIKSHFEDVGHLIGKGKSATIKNKTRQAVCYANNLPEVKAIVESFKVRGKC